MVVEELFKTKWVEKRPFYSFLLGVFFAIISFVTSYFLFWRSPQFIGVSTILFTVALVIPTINKLFDREERLEAREKLKFFIRHEHFIDFFVYFFIGFFLILFLIAMVQPTLILTKEQLYDLNAPANEPGRQLPLPPGSQTDYGNTIGVFKNNMFVLFISFTLSLFYGAGAIFLITLNASIFASTLAKVIKGNLIGLGFISISTLTLCNLGIFLFHGIPEVAGYILAAIAGGVLSHAFVREKFGGKRFKSVLIDSVILLLVGIALLIFAAVVEVGISKQLYASDVCSSNGIQIILILILIISSVILIESLRNKRYRRR
jgi:uncharacterized membrane protein SpoIIM required for sporulation